MKIRIDQKRWYKKTVCHEICSQLGEIIWKQEKNAGSLKFKSSVKISIIESVSEHSIIESGVQFLTLSALEKAIYAFYEGRWLKLVYIDRN